LWEVETNRLDPDALVAAVRRAEYIVGLRKERAGSDLYTVTAEAYAKPPIWSDATAQLSAEARADVMQRLVKPVEAAGMMAAGYIEVSASGQAVMDDAGRTMYYPHTQAQYSVVVRDPEGTGSGWAGVDWFDWAKIDADRLSAVALDKCLRSRNPVAIEPGRYTAILEPQAVCDLWADLVLNGMNRTLNEDRENEPFHKSQNLSKLTELVVDHRVTITSDPMDSMLGFPPFDLRGNAFHATTWIENGVLKNLSYDHEYAVQQLMQPSSRMTNGAFHMSGGTATVDDMIATTQRGLLVTRFWDVRVVNGASWLLTGYTRDGLWLIEKGKISKPVKNFRFTESPLFAFNNLEEMGVPQRAFHPQAPVVVPAAKVRDFNFSSLADAV
jgi:predicted Zn-dependent protease